MHHQNFVMYIRWQVDDENEPTFHVCRRTLENREQFETFRSILAHSHANYLFIFSCTIFWHLLLLMNRLPQVSSHPQHNFYVWNVTNAQATFVRFICLWAMRKFLTIFITNFPFWFRIPTQLVGTFPIRLVKTRRGKTLTVWVIKKFPKFRRFFFGWGRRLYEEIYVFGITHKVSLRQRNRPLAREHLRRVPAW